MIKPSPDPNPVIASILFAFDEVVALTYEARLAVHCAIEVYCKQAIDRYPYPDQAEAARIVAALWYLQATKEVK